MYKHLSSDTVLRLSDSASIPFDTENQDYLGYLAWVSLGNTPDPVDPPTTSQVAARLAALVQQRLDAFARTRRYDNMMSLCSYATSAKLARAAEAAYGVLMRDQTWDAAIAIETAVMAQTRPVPTEAELLAELPALAWPV